jgi:hypothetical protein
MALPGYIYALINYSMPGLVKIGRTTRAPGERGTELSAATGVPTPFVLLLDVLVPDAEAAEAQVHHILEQRGYRAADNREFFTAPPSEVIRLLLQVREVSESPRLEATSGLLLDAHARARRAREVAEEVVGHLCNLGYRRRDAQKAVDQEIAHAPGEKDGSDLIRKALRRLSNNSVK